MKKQFIIKPNMEGVKELNDYIGQQQLQGKTVTVTIEEGVTSQRTTKQNSALHKYFALLSTALNDAGLDMKKVLKETVDIPWTPEAVKSHIWKPVQKAMIEKASTTQLSRLDANKIYDVVNRHLAEKTGVHVHFPSKE